MHVLFCVQHRELEAEKCVEARILRLEELMRCRPKLPEKVFFVSTLKGQVSCKCGKGDFSEAIKVLHSHTKPYFVFVESLLKVIITV